MKTGLSTVVSFEILRTLKKASFWISALAVPVAGAVIGVLLYFSNHAASKSTTAVTTHDKHVAIFDQSGIIDTAALARAHISSVSSVDQGIHKVQIGQLDAFIYFPAHVAQQGITVYAQQTPAITSSYNTLATNLLRGSALQQMRKVLPEGQQATAILETAPTVHTSYFKNGNITKNNTVIVPGILAVVFLVLLVLSANQMITGVTEEKENRIIEILLTSVSSRSMIIGKIISITALALLQLVIIVIPLLAVDLTVFRHSSISMLHVTIQPLTVLLSLAYDILGFLLFTALLMGIGALSPSAKDAGPFTAVTFIWTYAPFYILGLLLSNSQNIIVTIFSYFPLTMPTTMLIRNALGTTSPVLISVTLPVLTICTVLAMIFAVRAFTNGSMEFSRRVSMRSLFTK